jgi:hypothetical protein
MPQLKFFFDNDVPDGAAVPCQGAGHVVIFMRDILPTDAPDLLVARTSESQGAILVCFDKHHKKIVPQLRTLALLKMDCTQPLAASRLADAMSLIEDEYALAEANGSRMHVSIGKGVLRTHR